MFYPKKLPNYIRYFRGRFSHLIKPSVWGPSGVVFLVLLFAWELSVNPKWLIIEDDNDSVLNSNTITENLSPEEISIMSDIDSSSVLIEELEINKNMLMNPILIPKKKSLKRSKKEKKKSVIKPEEYLAEPQSKINIYGEVQTNNFPSTNKLPNIKSSTSPLLQNRNFLGQENKEEAKAEFVNPLENGINNYLSSKGKAESPSNDHSQGNHLNLYPTQIKARDIKSSTILNSLKSKISQSEEGINYNPPLPPISVTPPKPYYTNLSGVKNQINNQTDLPGYNYSPQEKSSKTNPPPLIHRLANNKDRVNVANENQNVLENPSSNPFSSSNNSFYGRGYNQNWNNPFRE
ncbi:MAG: hypothetical protein MGF17_09800 [Trichodesmium sp. MAG_R04]|nr:hypothetical protein [Trichodesmium sp. MAG_R04]